MAKSIKFTRTGSSTTLGNFGPGDIARNLPDDMADHLVNAAQCAEYWEPATPAPTAPVAPPAAEPEKPARKPRKAAVAEAASATLDGTPPAADPAADQAADPEFPPKDPDEKGGDNNPLTEADAAADLAGQPRPE